MNKIIVLPFFLLILNFNAQKDFVTKYNVKDFVSNNIELIENCESGIVSKIDESKLSKIKLNKFIQKVNDSNAIISIFLNRDLKERLPEWEEIAAVSMSVQNMWLTCYANNIGSYWSTPSFLKEYGDLIDLAKNETSLGFFFMGVYDHKESPKLRDDINSKVDWV